MLSSASQVEDMLVQIFEGDDSHVVLPRMKAIVDRHLPFPRIVHP
jgi:hypothetical protein